MAGLRRVLVNIGFIMGSNLLGRVFNLVLQAALARAFGPVGLGGYATAVAIAGYFVFVVDFGLSPRLSREGAVEPGRLNEEYAGALGLKLLVGLGAFATLGAIYHVLPYEDDVRALCFLLGVSSIIRSLCYLNEAVCRASERLDLEGASNLLGAASFVGLSIVLIALDYPVVAVGYASIAANLLQLVVSSTLASRFVRLRVRFRPEARLARAALPYATTSLTVLAFAQIDVLLISFMESQEFVGQYAAVSRLLLIAGTVGALASAAILPTLARLYARFDAEPYRDLVNQLVRGVILVSGLVMLGTFVVASPLIVAIYGDAFGAYSPLLQGGSIYLAFKLPVSILGAVLTAVGRQGDRARGMLIGLAMTILLVLGLVPAFGLEGAVGAMIGSELVLMIVLAWFLRGMLQWTRALRTVSIMIVASGLGGAIHLWAGEEAGLAHGALGIGLPVLAYLGATALSGELTRAARFIRRLNESTSSAGSTE